FVFQLLADEAGLGLDLAAQQGDPRQCERNGQGHAAGEHEGVPGGPPRRRFQELDVARLTKQEAEGRRFVPFSTLDGTNAGEPQEAARLKRRDLRALPLHLQVGEENDRAVLQHQLRVGGARDALQQAGFDLHQLSVRGSLQQDLLGGGFFGSGQGRGSGLTESRFFQVGRKITEHRKAERIPEHRETQRVHDVADVNFVRLARQDAHPARSVLDDESLAGDSQRHFTAYLDPPAREPIGVKGGDGFDPRWLDGERIGGRAFDEVHLLQTRRVQGDAAQLAARVYLRSTGALNADQSINKL